MACGVEHQPTPNALDYIPSSRRRVVLDLSAVQHHGLGSGASRTELGGGGGTARWLNSTSMDRRLEHGYTLDHLGPLIKDSTSTSLSSSPTISRVATRPPPTWMRSSSATCDLHCDWHCSRSTLGNASGHVRKIALQKSLLPLRTFP